MKLLKNNKGSGIAVIIYGVVLMLALVFTAINILNAKVIENGYNSLRDAVFSASSGSVIHLLTSQQGGTASQNEVITKKAYDVYLQLALGYIINRTSTTSSTAVNGAEINNFIKLDHKKVVNSTMALLDDAVMRNKKSGAGKVSINETDKFKILMFFIEPRYSETDYEKYFDIIMYTNKDCDDDGNLIGDGVVDFAGGEVRGSMEQVYSNIQSRINGMVNETFPINGTRDSFSINLNATGGTYDELIRKMETMPYYIIVVKDFALPTVFDGVETNSDESIFKSAFTSLSGDGKLKTPMCALNSGKTERKLQEDGYVRR